MKKDMLYFANLDYLAILKLKDDSDLQDLVLVHCQQSVEKYLKYLMQRELGQKDTTHAITRMAKELYGKYPNLKSYANVLRILKDSYFDRRYETENYEHLDRDEFDEILTSSLELIEYLRVICLNQDSKVSPF